MIDLGTFGGGYSGASAVSDSGDVVGYSSIGGDVQISHAFSWRAHGRKEADREGPLEESSDGH
jgi:probable HAF family extracellular repeat protein